jgi:hypothetical protein
MIMSQTVVFPDAVPPATPALINPYALNPHTLQANTLTSAKKNIQKISEKSQKISQKNSREQDPS